MARCGDWIKIEKGCEMPERKQGGIYQQIDWIGRQAIGMGIYTPEWVEDQRRNYDIEFMAWMPAPDLYEG